MTPDQRILSLAKGLNRLKAFEHLTTPETRASISVISGGILGLFKSYTKNEPFQSTTFFEQPRSIGFTIAANKPTPDELPNVVGLKEALDVGFNLPNLTPFVFTNYSRFLEGISDKKLIDTVGDRVFEFSGLVPITENRVQETVESIKKLLEKHDGFLKEKGVSTIDHQDGLIAFKGENGLPVPVRLHYIKQGELTEEIVREKVLDNLEIAAIATPLPGENKRQHLARIKSIEERLGETVASGWPGQLRLWEKLGFDDKIPTANKDASLTAHELVRYLILGADNLTPGPLAKHTSLPFQGLQIKWPTLDMVLNRVSPNTGVRNVAPLSLPLRALDKDDPQKIMPLEGVAAFKILPEEINLKEAVEANVTLSRDFARVTGTPEAKILLVNRPLYENWQRLGSPIAPQEEVIRIQSTLSPKKRISYGLSSPSGKNYYTEFSVEPGAGGGMRAIIMGNQPIFLDVGTHFDDKPTGFRGMGKRPPTAELFIQEMRLGIMPPISGLWSGDVLRSIVKRLHNISDSSQDWLANFVLAEIKRRQKTFDFSELPSSLPDLIKQIKLDDKETLYPIFISNSHPHDDHHHFLALTEEHIPIIVSTATFAMLTAQSTKALTWQTRFLQSTHFSYEKRPYQKTDRIIFPIHDTDLHPLSSNLSVAHIPIPHSVPAVARVFRIKNGEELTLFDTGDWRNDLKNGGLIAFERAKKFSPEIATIEMSSIQRNGRFHTEEEVRDTILNILEQSPNTPTVIVVPINSLGRIKHIVEEIGDKTKRLIALDYAIAENVRTLSHFKHLYPGGMGLEYAIEKSFGKGLTVWEKYMASPKRSRRDLMETLSTEFGVEPLNPESLSRNGSNPIILISPYANLGQFDGINFPNGLNIIYAASSPFDREARDFMAANRKALSLLPAKTKLIAQFNPFKYGGSLGERPSIETITVNGPLHASGHATQKDIIDAIDILRGDSGDLTVIPYHTAHPVIAAEIITKKLGTHGLKFITRKPRLHLKNPLEHGIKGMGFWLPLE